MGLILVVVVLVLLFGGGGGYYGYSRYGSRGARWHTRRGVDRSGCRLAVWRRAAWPFLMRRAPTMDGTQTGQAGCRLAAERFSSH
jgi:hypothetical protein